MRSFLVFFIIWKCDLLVSCAKVDYLDNYHSTEDLDNQTSTYSQDLYNETDSGFPPFEEHSVQSGGPLDYYEGEDDSPHGHFDSFYENKQSLYDILGTQRNATMDEISKAYKEKAKQYHPDMLKDVNTTKEELESHQNKFIEVSTAYQILKDPIQRLEYDQRLNTEEQEHFEHEKSLSLAQAMLLFSISFGMQNRMNELNAQNSTREANKLRGLIMVTKLIALSSIFNQMFGANNRENVYRMRGSRNRLLGMDNDQSSNDMMNIPQKITA